MADVEDLAGSDRYDVVVVGAGCIGASIARQLSRFENLRVLVVEKESDVSQGASKANSGIVHGGYDAKGKWKGRFEREGNELFGEVCHELNVPFKRIGSLVLSFTERDDIELDKLVENGKKNGLRNLEIWDREQILKEEPHVSVGVRRALHCPTAGITNPYLFTIASCENAIQNGVKFLLSIEVTDVKRVAWGFELNLRDVEINHRSSILTKRVVNCTGVFSDTLVSQTDFEIKPRRGEYVLLSKEQGHMATRVLFQAPTARWGKGVLVSPTVDGNLLVGPSASDTAEKTNKATTFQELGYVAWAARRSVPHLDTRMALRSFAGIRAKSSTGDFVISEDRGFVHVAGIDSPGLTGSPAIAIEVVRQLGLRNALKTNWMPTRETYDMKSRAKPPQDLRFDHPDPDLNIVCRCEAVTESTIREATTRGIPVRCTDSIKWRTRAGMGQCGGIRCRTLVRGIIAETLGLDVDKVPQTVIGQEIPHRLNREELGRL